MMTTAKTRTTTTKILPAAAALILALAVAFASTGCALGDDDGNGESQLGATQQAATTGASSGGGVVGGVGGDGVAEKPKQTPHQKCMDGCKAAGHLNATWCDSYCDCKLLFGGGEVTCSNAASGTLIDL